MYKRQEPVREAAEQIGDAMESAAAHDQHAGRLIYPADDFRNVRTTRGEFLTGSKRCEARDDAFRLGRNHILGQR